MDPRPPPHWWHAGDATGVLDTDALRQLTRGYWQRNGTLEQRIGWYVQELLPQELRYAEQRGALGFHECHTLVLLVGHSIEPLLQAVSVFRPEQVVLVLSQQYDRRDLPEPQPGEAWGQEVGSLLGRLPQSPAVALCQVPDQPEDVFSALCDQVLDERQAGQPVIVDITGGKKSMVAGAFLFAAYADIPISYVNFDTFDEAMRRPLGFTCRIGWLTNPYDAFRLREWERVRRLYNSYHFRAAAETLGEILSIPQFVSGLSQNDAASAGQALLQVLRFYEAWDDGDYHRARHLLSELRRRLPSFVPPAAVDLLAERFPHAEGSPDAESAARQLLDLHGQLRTPPDSLFEVNDLLVTYARDELAKIERLVGTNEDNRSALLRAAGLDELLLKARLVRLWYLGWIDLWDNRENYLGHSRSLRDSALRGKLYGTLIDHQGTDHMRNALRGARVYDRKLGKEVPAFVRLDVWRDSYRARPSPDAPTVTDYAQGVGLSGETLTQLRNQAIHMYLYVTQPVAEAAVALARANLEEFESHWAMPGGTAPHIEPVDVQCLPWDEVCHLCGVDFLPVVLRPRQARN